MGIAATMGEMVSRIALKVLSVGLPLHLASNFALDRAASSHSLTAAGQHEC
jgi:hypothetical protein